MAYEMNQQPTSYPYPPPAMAAPVVAMPPRQKHFSKWWPISFFIAAFVMIITGGGLIGAWSASASCVRSSYSSYRSSYYSCSDSGMFYGGVACIAIGGVCKLIAWILLIVFCVKRSHRTQTNVSYTYQPISHQYAAPAGAAAAAPPYAPAAMPGAKVGGERYCAHCGATVTAAFCAQCGNKA
ncbi:hypothetical protein C8A05DRAFT_39383 [Staphylotrichum tortipilum]|uniref:Uncharacterized protein n=1 Tax=Staphylotrichum tortipilum TaxID=2831512 RepID=A0AAN6RNE3_9PEZI|nr:hypothetical protein C8A05DRAFT_39383 [Staphylotrichum longicolle]